MIKCRDNNMSLHYESFIKHLIMLYDINFMVESTIILGWNKNFRKKVMKKLNIFEVNGVWQLGSLKRNMKNTTKTYHYQNNMLKAINLSHQSPGCPIVNPILEQDSRHHVNDDEHWIFTHIWTCLIHGLIRLMKDRATERLNESNWTVINDIDCINNII